MAKELKFLIKLVKKASKLIKDDFEVKSKDDKGDLVTNLDYAIEKFMIERMKKTYPDFEIVSEEFNTSAALSKNCFVIDPIDGTINFAHHFPFWGIQVACVKDGETVAAVIYLPKLRELFYADESGAFLNGKKISVSDLAPERCVYTGDWKRNLEFVDGNGKILTHTRGTGSMCVNYAFVACGRLGCAVFRKSNPWDYVPGMYIAKQAGAATYDSKNMHIAANTKEFLKIVKDNFKKDNAKK
ncbi:MAG: inositol monophosphatase [Clostridia bacterium]|nr:inositol monophosphatase [Clostridia bacterium]